MLSKSAVVLIVPPLTLLPNLTSDSMISLYQTVTTVPAAAVVVATGREDGAKCVRGRNSLVWQSFALSSFRGDPLNRLELLISSLDPFWARALARAHTERD